MKTRGTRDQQDDYSCVVQVDSESLIGKGSLTLPVSRRGPRVVRRRDVGRWTGRTPRDGSSRLSGTRPRETSRGDHTLSPYVRPSFEGCRSRVDLYGRSVSEVLVPEFVSPSQCNSDGAIGPTPRRSLCFVLYSRQTSRSWILVPPKTFRFSHPILKDPFYLSESYL